MLNVCTLICNNYEFHDHMPIQTEYRLAMLIKQHIVWELFAVLMSRVWFPLKCFLFVELCQVEFNFSLTRRNPKSNNDVMN